MFGFSIMHTDILNQQERDCLRDRSEAVAKFCPAGARKYQHIVFGTRATAPHEKQLVIFFHLPNEISKNLNFSKFSKLLIGRAGACNIQPA